MSKTLTSSALSSTPESGAACGELVEVRRLTVVIFLAAILDSLDTLRARKVVRLAMEEH